MVCLSMAYLLHELILSFSLCLPVDTARAFSTEEMKLLSVDTSGGVSYPSSALDEKNLRQRSNLFSADDRSSDEG